MSKKKKDPFAFLKTMGFDDLPTAEELAKVDEATGAKLLSQAMNATNVHKLASAEKKRDSRREVTSGLGSFGNMLSQSAGRTETGKAMATLEGDAKLLAKSQRAIDAFARSGDMRKEKAEMGDRNLELMETAGDREHDVRLQNMKASAANQRNQDTIRAKQLEDNKKDPMTEKQLFDARTKLADNVGLLDVEADYLVRLMDFRTKNPGTQLNVGDQRRVERMVKTGVLTKGEILDELQGKTANTINYKIGDVKEGDVITDETIALNEAGLSGAALRFQRGLVERAFQESGGMGGSIIDFRDRVTQLLNGDEEENAHFRSELQKKVAGEIGVERATEASTKTTDEGATAEESMREPGLEKHLYNLTSRLVMASVKRMSGAEVTNFQLDKYSGLIGMKPGQTAHDQINALNDHARELEVMYSTFRSGYGQVIPEYVASNENTYLDKPIPRMDPGKIGEMTSASPPGTQIKLDADNADAEGVSGNMYRATGEHSGSQVFEQVGGNAVLEGIDDTTDLMNDIGGAVKKGASAIGRGVKGAWNAVTGQNDQSSMLPQAGAAMQQRQPQMARPPMPGQAPGNIPVPENEEQAQSLLAQTMAILNSQSQLGQQRNA
jgi:hypothetical protein